jgi:predicted metal-dependent HD superfamily phosphohydrolase
MAEGSRDSAALVGRERWRGDWREAGATRVDEAGYDQVMACYGEVHRAYHTVEHLRECFAWLERWRGHAERTAEVGLALWYHDAVYDTRGAGSEARSAALFGEVAAGFGVPAEVVARVQAAILVTAHLGEPVGADQEVLIDCDLAILGAEPARYARYCQDVRREYGWVPEAMFKATRARVLRGFLERERLFHTEAARAVLDAPARANLTRELSELG